MRAVHNTLYTISSLFKLETKKHTLWSIKFHRIWQMEQNMQRNMAVGMAVKAKNVDVFANDILSFARKWQQLTILGCIERNIKIDNFSLCMNINCI